MTSNSRNAPAYRRKVARRKTMAIVIKETPEALIGILFFGFLLAGIPIIVWSII